MVHLLPLLGQTDHSVPASPPAPVRALARLICGQDQAGLRATQKDTEYRVKKSSHKHHTLASTSQQKSLRRTHHLELPEDQGCEATTASAAVMTSR